MKYTITSSEASKLLRKINEEKNIALDNEHQSCIFNASIQEDIESVRPEYSYEETQQFIENCDRKIRILKHAINCFNTTQTVGDTGMTIDQVLVYIPQLTEEKTDFLICRVVYPNKDLLFLAREITLLLTISIQTTL